MHLSLLNVIERSIGVLKKRLNIINLMPPYDYPNQVKIVVACMVLHNYIIEQRQMDEVLKNAEIANVIIGPDEDTDGNVEPTNLDEMEMGLFRDHIRGMIVDARRVLRCGIGSVYYFYFVHK